MRLCVSMCAVYVREHPFLQLHFPVCTSVGVFPLRECVRVCVCVYVCLGVLVSVCVRVSSVVETRERHRLMAFYAQVGSRIYSNSSNKRDQ